MPAEHVVSFTAEDGHLIARCTCGWEHKWRPWKEVPAYGYGLILEYGLWHTLPAGTSLPSEHNAQ